MKMEFKNQCQMCRRVEAKYVCPRCNIPYCSLPCYQSESHVQCSESFYKDCVVEQIRDDRLDPESQQKMVEILRRVEQVDSQVQDEEALDSDDSDGVAELADRVAGVDLDDADSVWAKLTEDEKRQFQQLVMSGDVSELMPLWDPWWNCREEKKLVRELDENLSTEEEHESSPKRFPPKQVVPPLSELSKVTPSPIVRWNVVNVLAAYAITARVYNGDLQSAALDAAATLTTVSENLAANRNFENVELAVVSAQMAAINNGCFLDGVDENMLKEDVRMLVEGPSESRKNEFVLRALSEIHSLFTDAKRRVNKGTTSKTGGEFSKKFPDPLGTSESKMVTSKDLNKHIKKIEFYISWTKECF